MKKTKTAQAAHARINNHTNTPPSLSLLTASASELLLGEIERAHGTAGEGYAIIPVHAPEGSVIVDHVPAPKEWLIWGLNSRRSYGATRILPGAPSLTGFFVDETDTNPDAFENSPEYARALMMLPVNFDAAREVWKTRLDRQAALAKAEEEAKELRETTEKASPEENTPTRGPRRV